MHAFDIILRETADIQSFANLVNDYPFTISLRQGRAVTDAKSILGIYSLDLTKPVTVEVYSNMAGELLEALQKFLTCRQQAFEICSLQSTKIHLVTARLDYAVFP